jgi:hypothetical protein
MATLSKAVGTRTSLLSLGTLAAAKGYRFRLGVADATDGAMVLPTSSRR